MKPLLQQKARRGRREALAVVLVVAAALVLVVRLLDATSLVHNADSASLYQLVETTLATGVPRTSIGGSSLDATPTWWLPAAEACRLPLSESGGAGWSILGYHAYLIAYPLSLLTLLAPADKVVPAVTAFGYLALLGLCYLAVRRRRGSPLAATLVAILVAAHPIWSRGLMADYYFDRLFLPLGFLLLLLLHDPIARGVEIGRGRWAAVAVTALLAASTNDRSSFYVALIFAGLLAGYGPRLTVRTRLILAGFAGFFAAWLVLYTSLLMSNYNLTSLETNASGGLLQAFSAASVKFLVIDFLCFGLLALFEPRLALLAAAAVLPNLLVTIGGVEKYGFHSHYHSQYFAILAYAVACGTGRAWALSARLRRPRPGPAPGLLLAPVLGPVLAPVLVVTVLLCGSGLLLTADDGPKLRFQASDWPYRAFARVWAYDTGDTGPLWSALDAQRRAQTLRSVVPPSAAVSTVEGYLPAFYRTRNPSYYPINIDRTDYVVLPYGTDDQGRRLFTGAISYAGQNAELDRCLNQRLREHGFDLDHPVWLDAQVAVLKRGGGPN